MTDTTIDIASDRLRWIADQLDLTGHGRNDIHITVMIQPGTNGDTTVVDDIADALGTEAAARRLSSGCWHHTGRRTWGRVQVTVMTEAAEPIAEKRERLAAELAELDARIAANSQPGLDDPRGDAQRHVADIAEITTDDLTDIAKAWIGGQP